MQLEPKFAYSKLERVEINGKRFYTTNGIDRLPSVTTVLGETKDMTILDEWIKKVGLKEAERIKIEAGDRGTEVHSYMEKWLKGDYEIPGDDFSNLPAQMADVIRLKIKDRINEIYAPEARLYYPEKYAGTSDFIGVFDGKEHILDFKQSNKFKKEEWDVITDYKIQTVAYALAHNKLFGTNIHNTKICVCSIDLVYQEFSVNEREFNKYAQAFWDRLEIFNTLQKL